MAVALFAFAKTFVFSSAVFVVKLLTVDSFCTAVVAWAVEASVAVVTTVAIAAASHLPF